MPSSGIVVNGRPLAGGRLPAVCAPLVARTDAALLAEAALVAAHSPDLLEWRVDFYDAIADTGRVLRLGAQLREAARGIPLLFTRRSVREGGQAIALEEEGVVALYRAVCASGLVDLMDFEMGNAPADVAQVRAFTRAAGMPLVLSFHDFGATPPDPELAARFAQAKALDADVAKVAVMPSSVEDVHRLLGATLQASKTLGIPVISMAMGPLGAVSRLCGGVFGSALTFAMGAAASAPGQMPIEDVRAGLTVLQRAGSP
ncbi:type I 3-dehydroquinate dehydratase [Caenimonas sedimenti]|uniref:3-dehydroquinate dehydratase n=1 Tax=Caenimonas sedimenti TaxID=2596921 RepID=A0A562ZXV0_9BURK|nr:type I 3-dehydroquinate dehydratase [Caenimonas sedimenti]TWO73158.1 type I 3-dehydroquinate dehydratase [Caenimonas sedimenti]